MENKIAPSTETILRCDACFTEIGTDDVYCANCGYPTKGTAAEQAKFISKKNRVDVATVELTQRVTKSLNKAGRTLYYLSGLFILGGIIAFFKLKDDPEVLGKVIPYLILGVVFLLLGEYSKKHTLACFISGLCLFVIVQVLNLFQNPDLNLYSFLIMALVIGFLIMGIKSAIEIEKIKKHNKTF